MTDRSSAGDVRRCNGTDAPVASTIVMTTAAGSAETSGTLVAGTARNEVISSSTVASVARVRQSPIISMGRRPSVEQPADFVPDNVDDADKEANQQEQYQYQNRRLYISPRIRSMYWRSREHDQLQQQTSLASAGDGVLHYSAPDGRVNSVACLRQALAAAAAMAAASEGPVAAGTGAVSYASLLSQFREGFTEDVPAPASSSSCPQSMSSSSPSAAISGQIAPVLPMYLPPVDQYRLQSPLGIPFLRDRHDHRQHHHHQHHHPYTEHMQPLHPSHDHASERSPYSDFVPVVQGLAPPPGSTAAYVSSSSTATSSGGRGTSSFTSSVGIAATGGDSKRFASLPRNPFAASYHDQRATSWLQSTAAAVHGSPFVVPGFIYPPAPSISAAAAAASAVLSNIAQTYRRGLSCSSKSPPTTAVSMTTRISPIQRPISERRRDRMTSSTSSSPTPLTISTSVIDESTTAARRSPAQPSSILMTSSTTTRRRERGSQQRNSDTVTGAAVTTSASPRCVPSITSTARRPSLHPGDAAFSAPNAASVSRAEIERHTTSALTSAGVESYYPAHFTVGSVIDLGGGVLKRVENLKTEDFVRSADTSNELKLDMSTVVHMEHDHDRHVAVLGLTVGRYPIEVTVEAPLEHPFFVFDHGWSSCSPDRTMSRYGLDCHRLAVGDCCISLTPRPSQDAADTGGLIRTPRAGFIGSSSSVITDSSSSAVGRFDVSAGVSLSANRSSQRGRGHASHADASATRPVDYTHPGWSDRDRVVCSSGYSARYDRLGSSEADGTDEGQLSSPVGVSRLVAVPSTDHDTRCRSALTGKKRRHSDSDARCLSPSGGRREADDVGRSPPKVYRPDAAPAAATVTVGHTESTTGRAGATIENTVTDLGWTSPRQPSAR